MGYHCIFQDHKNQKLAENYGSGDGNQIHQFPSKDHVRGGLSDRQTYPKWQCKMTSAMLHGGEMYASINPPLQV